MNRRFDITLWGAATAVAGLGLAGAALADRNADCEPHWDLAASQSSINSTIEAVGGFGDDLYVGGLFTAPFSRIAKWGPQPSLVGSWAWSDVGGGVSGTFGVNVLSLAVWNDGSGPALFVGGGFTTAGGLPANRIAKWNGNQWSALGSGIGPSGAVRAMIEFDDGSGNALYVGGNFGTAGDQTANGIARWNGQAWSPVGSVPMSHVYDMAIFDDGSGPALYAVGTFTTAGGAPGNRFAKWDGQQWTEVGGGLTGNGHAITVHDDGSGPALFIGGNFSTAGPWAASNIAKWDGQEWAPLGAGVNHWVWDLATFDDGSGPALYAAGLFTEAGGQPAKRIAKWDGEQWTPLDGGPDLGSINALAVFEDDSGPALYVVGSFTALNGEAANRVAAWRGCEVECAPADFNCDGVVDGADLLILLSEWGPCADPEDCPADLNEDGTVDGADLLILLSLWG